MSLKLKLCILLFAFILFIITSYLLKKEKISVKYSLVWYLISLILIIVALMPFIVNFVQRKVGFDSTSNMIIGIILCLLVFCNLALTIIVSGQKQKINLLIQEVSILKKNNK